jgi:hypothetical protein
MVTISRRKTLRNGTGNCGTLGSNGWAQSFPAGPAMPRHLIWKNCMAKTVNESVPETYFKADRFTSLFNQHEGTLRKDR